MPIPENRGDPHPHTLMFTTVRESRSLKCSHLSLLGASPESSCCSLVCLLGLGSSNFWASPWGHSVTGGSLRQLSKANTELGRNGIGWDRWGGHIHRESDKGAPRYLTGDQGLTSELCMAFFVCEFQSFKSGGFRWAKYFKRSALPLQKPYTWICKQNFCSALAGYLPATPSRAQQS